MELKFENVVPEPFANLNFDSSSFWGNSWTLSKGERVLLNASSGKGKTTFTHFTYGLRTDFKGTISFDNQSIKDFSIEKWTEIRQRKLAVVFQDLQLFSQLSVEDNLQLKASLTGNFDIEKAKYYLDFVDLADKWNQKCAILSMGQLQRVAIIRALLQPFEWIILDEPFSHLDIENASKCMQLINERCDELKAGFILTTLNSTDAISFSREIKL